MRLPLRPHLSKRHGTPYPYEPQGNHKGCPYALTPTTSLLTPTPSLLTPHPSPLNQADWPWNRPDNSPPWRLLFLNPHCASALRPGLPVSTGRWLLRCCCWLRPGMLTMYSSGWDHCTRFADHGRNMLIAATIMLVVAQIPPHRLMALAVPLYTLGVALLIAVAIFGITKKGARRWNQSGGDDSAQ